MTRPPEYTDPASDLWEQTHWIKQPDGTMRSAKPSESAAEILRLRRALADRPDWMLVCDPAGNPSYWVATDGTRREPDDAPSWRDWHRDLLIWEITRLRQIRADMGWEIDMLRDALETATAPDGEP